MSSRVYRILVAILAMACGAAHAQSDTLVTPAWLMARLDDPSVRIVDLGKTREEFESAHIPGAQHVDWRTDLVDPSASEYFAVAGRNSVEVLLSRLGIERDTTIVLYDSQSSRIAARMFWMLRYYGHDDVRILDGGSGAWAAAGGPQTGHINAVAPTSYRIDAVRDDLIADLEFVLAALERSETAIVDARAPAFFMGSRPGSKFLSDTPNARSGHVPGAKNFFWADHFDDDGRFKPVGELRAHYAAAGITPDKTIVTYCHIGLQGSTPWFVLTELLGYPNVRLYDYSMAEWANSSNTPIAVVAE